MISAVRSIISICGLVASPVRAVKRHGFASALFSFSVVSCDLFSPCRCWVCLRGLTLPVLLLQPLNSGCFFSLSLSFSPLSSSPSLRLFVPSFLPVRIAPERACCTRIMLILVWGMEPGIPLHLRPEYQGLAELAAEDKNMHLCRGGVLGLLQSGTFLLLLSGLGCSPPARHPAACGSLQPPPGHDPGTTQPSACLTLAPHLRFSIFFALERTENFGRGIEVYAKCRLPDTETSTALSTL